MNKNYDNVPTSLSKQVVLNMAHNLNVSDIYFLNLKILKKINNNY